MNFIKRIKLPKLIIIAVLGLIGLVMIVPVLNIFAKAFSHPDYVGELMGYDIFPKKFSLINFRVVFSNDIVWISVRNSIFITVIGTAINLLLTSSAAYVLTRPGLAGKKLLMFFFIIMMIFETGMIQEYLVMKEISLLDNLWSMILYKSVNVYYLILLMRFFSSMPGSLLEAAKIDGAGHMTMLFKIVIPLNKVSMLSIGMFYAITRWNEFFKSSIFLVSKGNTVLQVFLRQFIVEEDRTALIGVTDLLTNNSIARLDYKALQAATIVVAMVPILLLYPIILRYYTSGVLVGAVKE